MNYLWIDKQELLDNAIQTELVGAKSLAVDTEFMGAAYYSPKLCLLQICSQESKTVLLVDGLANLTLKTLSNVLKNPKIEKVFHAPKQDLAILEKEISAPICNVFDTQLAASFIGFGDQVSLKKLLKEILQIEHPKEQQFSNWEKRPLKEKQLNYAVQDVSHLIELGGELKNRLQQVSRYQWFQEESKNIEASRTMNDIQITKKTSIAGKNWLKSHQFPLLNQLAKIREEFAQKQNKPREFYMTDYLLVKLVRIYYHCPDELINEMEQLDVPEELKKNCLESIQNVRSFESFRSESEEVRPTDESKALSDVLFQFVNQLSTEYKISLPLLATRSELNEFSKRVMLNSISNDKQIRFLSGWRFSFFGKTLIEEANKYKKNKEDHSNEK